MKDFSRSNRLSSQISRELANFVLGNPALPHGMIVSINEVNLSRDLRNCKIYYSVYGDDKAVETAAEFFRNHYGQIRKTLADNTRMRFIPELKFIYDPSIERGQRVSELLDKIKQDEQED